MMRSSGALGRGGWHRLGLVAAVGALLLMQGCLIITADPNSASIAASWTIDGRPASAATCAEIGMDRVELVLYDASSTEVLRLRNSCSSGVIDSRGTDVFISGGDYEVAFEGFLSSARVATSERTPIRLVAGNHHNVSTNFVSGTSFDPRGTDGSVEAHWTIDGGAPSVSDCASLGIASIRVAFQNGASWYEHPALTASCASGVIDTGATAVVAAGTWGMQLQALDASGGIIAQGPLATLTVTPGSRVVLDPVDFSSGRFNPMGTDATVEASWQLNGRPATSDSCFAVGIDKVQIVLYAETDTAYEHGVAVASADCETGLIDSRPGRVVRAGRYLVALEAIDSLGALVSDYSEMTPITVPVGGRVQLPLVGFTFPETLTLSLSWQNGVGGPMTTCSEAGVATYSYTLRDNMSAIVADATSRPCADLISFDSTSTAGFGPGKYYLYMEGFNAAARKQWSIMVGDCSGVEVGSAATTSGPNSLVAADCRATFTP